MNDPDMGAGDPLATEKLIVYLVIMSVACAGNETVAATRSKETNISFLSIDAYFVVVMIRPHERPSRPTTPLRIRASVVPKLAL